MNTIVVKNLSKHFGAVKALDKISFTVEEGSITGFLGPNGAGKSTTMNVLLGFISATAGSASLLGKKITINDPTTRRDVGYLAASAPLDRSLRAWQEIEYYGHLAKNYDKQYVDELAGKLSLDLNAKIGTLSTGNHQKVALIIALMTKPKLLILDEPTNGLDPLVQAEFNKIIMDLKKQGSTIFISSHILSEVDELCDTFIFIRAGKIVAEKTRAELRRRSRNKLIHVKSEDFERAGELLIKAKIPFKVTEQTDLSDEFMSYYTDEDKAGKKGGLHV